MQQRLVHSDHKRRLPDEKQLNRTKGDKQSIKLSEGCPHLCPFCYEGNKLVVFPIPSIRKNFVEIWDMNFLWQPNILNRIKELGKITVDDKVVYYDAVCGFDYRLMTQEIADTLKTSRFTNIRIAWDWFMKDQHKIRDTIDMFEKAGYVNRYHRKPDTTCFMLANWKIPYDECIRKLDLLKVWNVKVCGCCFDGGYRIAIPEYWTDKEINDFREKCRKHNQIVGFGIDPEL